MKTRAPFHRLGPATTPAPSATAPSRLSRRQFVTRSTTAAASAATFTFNLVPRSVLGGPGFVPPSEKITLAYLGCGTQGLRELPALLGLPDLQVVAVCDPVRIGHDYVDWSADGLRSSLAAFLGQPDWRKDERGIPGGREVAREIVEKTYAARRASGAFRGCAAYADFRELLEKEADLDSVKIMTPDHLHATIALAAMRRGRHVMMHKPLANRLVEARHVVDAARRSPVATHFLPASDGARIRPIKAWIDAGAIGTLREIHNWSNRPVWPQYRTVPTDTPPVPEGFDWSLWLGPSTDRPYHPHYTHAVFRGWYEFGGGALADMGHYSLWPVFREFDLDAPWCVESRASHTCGLQANVAVRLRADASFPDACTIRFRFAAKGSRPALDLFWYDGSMKPPTPEELEIDHQELAAEGMLWIGDRGKILADFRGENPRLIPERRMREHLAANPIPATARESDRDRDRARDRALVDWIAACRGGPATFGDFRLAGPISDAFNLGAVSLRLGGRRLLFDAAAGRITNLPEANRLLTREYRPGWELPAA